MFNVCCLSYKYNRKMNKTEGQQDFFLKCSVSDMTIFQNPRLLIPKSATNHYLWGIKNIRSMRYLVFVLAGFLSLPAYGQLGDQNIGEGLLINLSYAYQIPGEDMSTRFGSNFNLGLNTEYITTKSNFIFGLEGQFLFGNNVKTDVLASLRTPEGSIIADDRTIANILLRQRGFYFGGLVGKIFSLSPSNPRSGIRITLGAGLLQHKIRIQDDPSRDVSPLADEYKKGYDRLTNGLALTQFIGYQLLSRNRRVNFYIGLELTEGFTQSRRDFNFDTRDVNTETRFDLLYGIRAGWVVPFYFGDGSDEIYY